MTDWTRRAQDAAFLLACMAVLAATVANASLPGPSRTPLQLLLRAG